MAFEEAAEEVFAEGVFDFAFDYAFERAGAEFGRVAGFDEIVDGLGGEDELDVLVGGATAYLGEFITDDDAQVFFLERAEDDDVVEAVDEFRAEFFLDFVHELLLHGAVVLLGAGASEAEAGLVLDDVCAEVARHDEQGVAEVDFAAKGVGEAAFFHDLQEHVEDVGVGLFDFVEQDDSVGAAADFLGELAAFFIADIAGGRADEAADVVLFHVFGHVHLDEGVFGVEHVLGQGAGEEGFADAGGPEKDEAAHGPVRILESSAGAAHGAGDGGDGLVLADDHLMEGLFHLEESFGLVGFEAREGHAGHFADDLGHDFLVDNAVGFPH